MTTHTTFTTNRIAFDDVLAAAREYGEQAGRGRDTQIKFLLKVVDGAHQHVLDTVRNKHGDGIDDATALGGAYVTAQQGAVVFDAKAPNQRKLISCVRTAIRLGHDDKDGKSDPVLAAQTLMNRRERLKSTPGVQVMDAANTLLKFARAQAKSPVGIPVENMDEFCIKVAPRHPAVEGVLRGMEAKLDALLAGESPTPYGASRIMQARNAIRRELA